MHGRHEKFIDDILKYIHIICIDTFVVPSEPQLLRETVSVNSSSVTLQWSPPVTPNGIITQYSLQYNTTAVAATANNVLMYTVSGLSPETVYVLQVRAHTSVGAGPPSNITVITRKLYLLYFACTLHLYCILHHIECDIRTGIH